MAYQGVVTAEICDVRFAFSGKLAAVHTRIGDSVQKGAILATLDRTILQTELDRQLADYERIRAEFDMYIKKSGQNTDDISKFTRQSKQAELNASVKDVELAKYRLDQADLVCPVQGIIIDMSAIAPGLYVTSSANPVRILNTSSFIVQCDVPQSDIQRFFSEQSVTINIQGTNKETHGRTRYPIQGKDGICSLFVTIDDMSGLFSGMKCEVVV